MAQDRYKYFRVEARDLVDQMGQGILDLEKGTPSADGVARLLRLAHTLKGAARVVKQPEIANGAHAIEDTLAPFRDSSRPVSRDGVDLLLKLLDEINGRIARLDAPAPARSEPASAERAERAELPSLAFRLPMEDLETVLAGLVETHVLLGAMRPKLDQVGHARRLVELMAMELTRAQHREGTRAGGDGSTEKVRLLVDQFRGILNALEQDFNYGLDQVDRELAQVRESTERLRLTPTSALFTYLERAARDVATAQGKRITFTTEGGDVRVDAFVLSVVQGALLQIVRNAVAHGIESTESDRALAGKPLAGRVSLRVTQRGRRVVFECTDDGRGVDLEAVHRIARQKGLHLDQGRAQQPEDLLRLLLKGGITTSGTVTDLSGRGVGLDVVREAMERLGGEANIRTHAGRGTTVELVVPVSVTSLQALVVEASGTTAAVPLDAVKGAFRFAQGEIVRTVTGGETILADGQALPLGSLRHLMSATPSPRTAGHSSAIVVQGRDGSAAISVDRILGTSTAVMRPLPELAPAVAVIAGTTLDAIGNPRVILDPDQLVAWAQRAVDETLHSEPPVPILVVDDSLTTRMLERSILESAGYNVDLAASAEEALDKARSTPYSLFLVDVEMPGMDGFTLIERIRADADLRDVPAILVTSRNTPEDRQRGRTVGAQAYIVKGDFDQGILLEHIRTLVR